jgi:hypothetical protein
MASMDLRGTLCSCSVVSDTSQCLMTTLTSCYRRGNVENRSVVIRSRPGQSALPIHYVYKRDTDTPTPSSKSFNLN